MSVPSPWATAELALVAAPATWPEHGSPKREAAESLTPPGAELPHPPPSASSTAFGEKGTASPPCLSRASLVSLSCLQRATPVRPWFPTPPAGHSLFVVAAHGLLDPHSSCPFVSPGRTVFPPPIVQPAEPPCPTLVAQKTQPGNTSLIPLLHVGLRSQRLPEIHKPPECTATGIHGRQDSGRS